MLHRGYFVETEKTYRDTITKENAYTSTVVIPDKVHTRHNEKRQGTQR